MERRTILKLVAAGVVPGSGGLVQIACIGDGYRPEFFSAWELALLDSLAEVILPRDDHSPGAKEALVARYIDVLVADGTPATQEEWRTGLEAVTALARQRHGRDFVDCDQAQQDAVVAEMARNEDDPQSEAERFFAVVKRATLNGYYTSQVGIEQELGYLGNTAVDEFVGCTHGEHGSG